MRSAEEILQAIFDYYLNVRLWGRERYLGPDSSGRGYVTEFMHSLPVELAKEGTGKVNVAVVGLGKLGLPLAVLLAEASHEVHGVDLNPMIVESVQKFRSPHIEPGLDVRLQGQKCRALLTASDRYDQIPLCRVSFVVVPTPTLPDGSFSNGYVVEAVTGIGSELAKRGRREHLVVVCSTVMPGSTDGPIRDALNDAAGYEVGLAYSPEFIALGSVLDDMQNPDAILIGSRDVDDGYVIEKILRSVAKNDPKVCRMSPVEAEIAKLSLNNALTLKISFANTVGALCEGYGADPSTVLGLVGADSRIGPKFLRAGMPFSGTCLPRDTVAFRAAAKKVGVNAHLSYAADAVNIERIHSIVDQTLRLPGPYGIVGLTYKEGTAVLEQAPGMKVARALIDQQVEVYLYDPLPEVQELAMGALRRWYSVAPELLRVVHIGGLENAKTILVTHDLKTDFGQAEHVLRVWQ